MAMVLAIPSAPASSAISDVPQAMERAKETSWLLCARSPAGTAFSPGSAASMAARAWRKYSSSLCPEGAGRNRT